MYKNITTIQHVNVHVHVQEHYQNSTCKCTCTCTRTTHNTKKKFTNHKPFRRYQQLCTPGSPLEHAITELGGNFNAWTTPICRALLSGDFYNPTTLNLLSLFFYGNNFDPELVLQLLTHCLDPAKTPEESWKENQKLYLIRIDRFNNLTTGLDKLYYYNVRLKRAFNLDGSPHTYYRKTTVPPET